MPTRIFDNDGQSAIVAKEKDYSEGNIRPRVIQFTDPTWSETSAPMCHLFFGHLRQKDSANVDVSTVLDGSVYLTLFPRRPIPLQLSGLAIVPTHTNITDYPTSNSASRQYLDFLDDKLAAKRTLDKSDLVTLTLEGSTEYKGVLVDSSLAYKRRGRPAVIFAFRMNILVLETSDLS